MFQTHLRADFLERIVRAIRGFTVSMIDNNIGRSMHLFNLWLEQAVKRRFYVPILYIFR